MIGATMTGSLRHLGQDRWQLRYYAGLNPTTGRQRERTKTFRAPNSRAAKKEADTIRAAIRAELDDKRERKGTVSELVDEWLDDRRRYVSPTTLPNYERIAKAINERFGRMRLADLRGRDLDRWYGELADGGMAPASIAKRHVVLRAMLREGERWEMVDHIATRRARPPKTQRREVRPPTTAALGVMLNDATGDLGTALRFMALTGLRRGELCGLRWSDVENGRLFVRRSAYDVRGGGVATKTPKSGRVRDLELGGMATGILIGQRWWTVSRAAHLGTRLDDDGPIWPDLRNDPTGRTPRRPGWLTLMWTRLRERHGATTVRLHDIRHWHVTTVLAAGVPASELSPRVGHSKTSVTLDVYGHQRDELAPIAAIEQALR